VIDCALKAPFVLEAVDFMFINRWFILGVLFTARFALGFQFQSAGSVTPFMVRDFGVDYAEVGTLVGLYMIPGLFLTVPSGFIGRRFGDKRIVLLGLTMMAGGGVLAGAAADYTLVVAGRLVSGSGAAVLFVLMTKMLTDWFVDKELFFGMSVFIIGWPIGIATGQAVQASIADASSWQVVFYLTALGCVVALLVVFLFYRTPPDSTDRTTDSFSTLSSRELFLVTIAGLVWMFVNGAYLVFVSFGPVFLQEHGVPFAAAGRVVSLMSWVFLFSLPLGGYLATRFRIPNLVMFSGLTGTIVVGALTLVTDVPFLTFTLFGIFYAAAVPVVASLPARVLRPETRGPGLGIYFIWYFLGSALLPIAAGYLKDLTGSAASSVLFGVAMMIATLTLAALFRLAQALPARARSEA
jgi:predicted MFS family arabinose efflux permease